MYYFTCVKAMKETCVVPCGVWGKWQCPEIGRKSSCDRGQQVSNEKRVLGNRKT